MMQTFKLATAAILAAFFMSTAAAQNTGTVTSRAFAVGKGPGTNGFDSVLCTQAQIAIGQNAAKPICAALSGDVTMTAAGVTAIGASKVTNAQLATMAAFTFKGNATGSTANPTDISIPALTTKASPTGSDYVLISDQAASGALKKAAYPTTGGLTVGTTPITGGTTGRPLYDNAGAVGEYTQVPTGFGGTGASNSTNATGDFLTSGSTNGTFAARSLNALCTLAPSVCSLALGYVNAAWYGAGGAACDGSTDIRVAMQAAITATPVGGRLYFPKQGTTGGCVVSKSAGPQAISISQPINIVCDPGVSIQPNSTLGTTGSTNDVIHWSGNSTGTTFSSSMQNCIIGNSGAATRFGRHGILFDTTTAGNYFARLTLPGVFVQAGTSGTGYGVYLLNDAVQNPNGGIFLSQIGDAASIFQGGVRLEGVGDSIKVYGTLPYNSAGSADNNGLWISLANGAGGAAGDLQVNINMAQPGGVQLLCGYNVEFRGEYELQAALTGNALLDISGANCTSNGVRVRAQMQAISGIGTPLLLKVSSNITAFLLAESNIATPTAYSPVNNASTTFQLGPNFWSVGGATHITGTAAANTFGGG
jgi:hypothetical protein